MDLEEHLSKEITPSSPPIFTILYFNFAARGVSLLRKWCCVSSCWGRGGALLILHDSLRRFLFQLPQSTLMCTHVHTHKHDTLQILHFWENTFISFANSLTFWSSWKREFPNLRRDIGENLKSTGLFQTGRNVYWTGILGVGVHLLASFLSLSWVLSTCPKLQSIMTRSFWSFVLLPTM